jgi:heme A synthase
MFLDTTQGLDIPPGEFQTLRAMHRLFASILGICVLILLIVSVWYRQFISPVLPSLMFIVVLFLSILGVSTPTRTIPAVTLGNVLGGIVLIGLIWRQILWLRNKPLCEGPASHLKILSLLVTLQLISGAWASANFTASACPELLQCEISGKLNPLIFDALNPFRELMLDSNDELIFDGAMGIIQFAHRLLSCMLLLLIILTFREIRNHHKPLVRAIHWLAVFFALEVILGVFNVLQEMPLWSNTLHNLLAVGLLLTTISLQYAASGTDATTGTNQ